MEARPLSGFYHMDADKFQFRAIRGLIASQSTFENKMMNTSFHFIILSLLFVSHIL